MTIVANLGLDVVNVTASTDTVVIDYSALGVTRYSIVTITVKDTSAAANTVDFYFSPDNTIASGDLMASQSLAAGEDSIVASMQAQASSNQNVVVNAAGACNIKVTVTTYDGV